MELLLRVGALFCLFGAIFPPVHAEIFTALVHMEGLVELEGELASQLRDYIRREKDRLRELERWDMCLFADDSYLYVILLVACVIIVGVTWWMPCHTMGVMSCVTLWVSCHIMTWVSCQMSCHISHITTCIQCKSFVLCSVLVCCHCTYQCGTCCRLQVS